MTASGMQKLTLPKNLILRNQKDVDMLHKKGSKVFCFPFVCLYSVQEALSEDQSFRFLVTVAKRKVPKAVDRNTIKRRTKELIRLNQNMLNEQHRLQGKSLSFLLIYIEKKVCHSDDIAKAICNVMVKINTSERC